MGNPIYDTSWTIYAVSGAETSYHNLSAATQESLDRRAQQFQDSLDINKAGYAEDSDVEKTGKFRECEWRSIEGPGAVDEDDEDEDEYVASMIPYPGFGVFISVKYDKAVHKFILYGAGDEGEKEGKRSLPLLLSKAPAPMVKKFSNFLAHTFHASSSVDRLELSTSVLRDMLHSYLDTLSKISILELVPGAPVSETSLANPSDQIIHAILGNLKISLAFSPPISPHLKKLEMDLPPMSVTRLLSDRLGGPDSPISEKISVLSLLADLLYTHTGLQIPGKSLPSSIINNSDNKNNNDHDYNPPEPDPEIMRISKITSAAFAIGEDGRVKLASKGVEAAGGGRYNQVVREANARLLARLVEVARKKSGGGEGNGSGGGGGMIG